LPDEGVAQKNVAFRPPRGINSPFYFLARPNFERASGSTAALSNCARPSLSFPHQPTKLAKPFHPPRDALGDFAQGAYQDSRQIENFLSKRNGLLDFSLRQTPLICGRGRGSLGFIGAGR